MDSKHMQSYFMVFDAKKIEEGPISRLFLPTFIPYGLHGCFVHGLTQEFSDITKRFEVYFIKHYSPAYLYILQVVKALEWTQSAAANASA